MNNRGLTLTELIVATILIAIVMLGVAVFSTTIKGVQDTTDKSTLLAMHMSAAMSHMTKNATLAIGHYDPTPPLTPLEGLPVSQGIRIQPVPLACPGSTGQEYIAFRQDQNTPQTPADYSDDTWMVYYRTCIDDNKLFFCVADDINFTNNGLATCNSAIDLVIAQGLVSAEFTLPIDRTPGNLNFYVTLKLKLRDDPTKPVDPINNPEMTFETHVSPPAHSW